MQENPLYPKRYDVTFVVSSFSPKVKKSSRKKSSFSTKNRFRDKEGKRKTFKGKKERTSKGKLRSKSKRRKTFGEKKGDFEKRVKEREEIF